ncbi:hypothetical protein ACOMHN_033586 [Nucella lapillus]
MENDVDPNRTVELFRGQNASLDISHHTNIDENGDVTNTSLNEISFVSHHTSEDSETGDVTSSRERLDFRGSSNPPERLNGSDVYPPPEHDDVTQDQHHRRNVTMDDSLDSVLVEDNVGDDPYVCRLKGLDNEAYAYDGDAETDLSYSNPTSPVDPPVLRNPDPFPVLERPLSLGRYHKNPSIERKKTGTAPPGPYDPHTGLYLAPPLATTKTSPPSATVSEGGGEGRGVRKRIPQPPGRLKMRCAFAWSCLACLLGNFFCAIPALRYLVTANESRKIGDYNSANSYLRKTALMAALALVLGVSAWTVVILYLSGAF